MALNCPEKLNSPNPELLNELAHVWLDFRDDENLLVAILSGEGKAFCIGADFAKETDIRIAAEDTLLGFSEAKFGNAVNLTLPLLYNVSPALHAS